MSIFATLKEAIRFREVTYYTVQMEGRETTLFLEFVNAHAKDYTDDLAIIRSWISKIGNEIGAKEEYFRPEYFQGGDASALPPPAEIIRTDCDLRLYCMRINTNAVVLFSGATKTAKTAQDCPNVRPHFLLANKLTKAINKAIQDRNIEINPLSGRLIIDKDLILEL